VVGGGEEELTDVGVDYECGARHSDPARMLLTHDNDGVHGCNDIFQLTITPMPVLQS
jgi:hypothetical protein